MTYKSLKPTYSFLFLLLFTKHYACSARLKLHCLNLIKYCNNNKMENKTEKRNGKQKTSQYSRKAFLFHLILCSV